MQEIAEIIKAFLKDLKHIILDVELEALANKLEAEAMSSRDVIKVMKMSTQFCMDKVFYSTKFVRKNPSPLLCLEPNCDKWHPMTSLSPTVKGVEKDPRHQSSQFCIPPITALDVYAAIKKNPSTVDRYQLSDFVKFGKDKKSMTIKEPKKKQRESNKSATPHCPFNCDYCTELSQQ